MILPCHRLWALLFLLATGWYPTTQQGMKSAFCTVKVVDASGNSVSNVRVHFREASSKSEKDQITDKAGNLTVELQPGYYDITLSSPGFNPTIMRDFEVAPGEHRHLELLLKPEVRDCCVDPEGPSFEPESSKIGNLEPPTGRISLKASILGIPSQIWGKWVVIRKIPTTTISCWDDTEAKKLLGSELEYSEKVFRWKDVVIADPAAEVENVSAEQFHDQNSGTGANSSQVTFRQLGIKAKHVLRVSIQHPPAKITGATVEIPGDQILVKNRDTIIFGACNIYFEAKRAAMDASAN